jgi:hypothetical protein
MRVVVNVSVDVSVEPSFVVRSDEDGDPVRAVSRKAALDAVGGNVRLRNYEIEGELSDLFGEHWIVWEPCPFNAEYCAWGWATGLVSRRKPDSQA